MSVEKVKEYFKKLGLDDIVVELAESSATVELAAVALGCKPERIAKTLAFKAEERVILIVAAGDAKIDNKKYKDTFDVKAKMLAYDEVEPLTGHKVGGVCPFAVNDGVEVFLDVSLKRFDYVFPAAGSNNSSVKLSIPQLELYSRSKGWVDVSKNLAAE